MHISTVWRFLHTLFVGHYVKFKIIIIKNYGGCGCVFLFLLARLLLKSFYIDWGMFKYFLKIYDSNL